MSNKKLLLLIPLGIGALFYMNKLNVTGHQSRGYRNNNPLNIRISNINWKGKVPLDKNTDGAFEQFYNRSDGYRAAALNILNYGKLYNVYEMDDVIRRWAPEVGKDPSGLEYANHTAQYIDYVEKVSGIWRFDRITPDNVSKLVWAMAQFENSPPHPDSLAFVESSTKEFRT